MEGVPVNIQVVFACLSVGIITFTWRYLLAYNRGKGFLPDEDSVVHHYFIKMFSLQPGKFKITGDDRFLVCSKTSYPQFFHKILAMLLGFDRFIRFKQMVNPVLDAFFNMILFGYSYFFIFKNVPTKNGLLLAFVTSILYLFSPLMIFFEGRVINFGERLFSYILGMISIISLILYINQRSVIFLLLAGFVNVLIIFSSQFTTQVILFFHLFASIAMLNPFPFLTVLFSVVISFVIAPRIMVEFVKAKYKHIDWYYKALKSRVHSVDFLYRKLMARMTVFGLAYILIIYHMPRVIKIVDGGLLKGMWVYILCSMITFVLVYLRVLRPFGEAVRYLEYSLPFVLILLVYVSALENNWFLLGILFFVNLISTIHYVIKFNMKVFNFTGSEGMIEFLKKHEDRVLLPIPFKLSYFIATHTKNRLVAAMLIGDDYQRIDSIRKLVEFPINDFEKIKSVYPFDWIVFRKGYENTYDLKDKRVVFQNAEYSILEM